MLMSDLQEGQPRLQARRSHSHLHARLHGHVTVPRARRPPRRGGDLAHFARKSKRQQETLHQWMGSPRGFRQREEKPSTARWVSALSWGVVTWTPGRPTPSAVGPILLDCRANKRVLEIRQMPYLHTGHILARMSKHSLLLARLGIISHEINLLAKIGF